MRALVKDLDAVRIAQRPTPTAAPGTVLVAVAVAGVCGSDLHMWRDTHSWPTVPGVALGHEMAGRIAAIGEGVEGFAVGDRVVCETAAWICGDCALCRTGRYNLCPRREGYGATRDGAFAEYVLAEPRTLHRIPDGVSDEQAAVTEPFAVSFNALVERGTIRPGDLVVVQGAGAIGAISAQLARLAGAGTVVVLGTDRDARRLEAVLAMGADAVIDVTAQDPVAVLAGLGDGAGAHVVVDATGVSMALDQGLDLVRPLGQIIKVGWGPQPLRISLDRLVQKAVSIHGAFSHTWDTWERVLALFAAGRLDPGSIVGGSYEPDDWERAFDDMESGRIIKSVLRWGS